MREDKIKVLSLKLALEGNRDSALKGKVKKFKEIDDKLQCTPQPVDGAKVRMFMYNFVIFGSSRWTS